MPVARRQDFPDISAQATSLERFFANLPRWAGNVVLNFFDDSWERQGFVDRRLSKWAKRKRPDANEAKRGERRTLVRTGRLRRGQRMKVSGNVVTIYNEVPYAQVHNEGGTVSGTASVRAHTRKGKPVRAHTRSVSFTMPKRQFMGESWLLRERITKHVERSLETIFNQMTR